MARDKEDRDRELRIEHLRRERPWGYDDPYAGRSRSLAGDSGTEIRVGDDVEKARAATTTNQSS